MFFDNKPCTCLIKTPEIDPLIVYREGDIVKQPMKKGSFVPKNVPGVGWGGVGWVGHEGVGWGGSKLKLKK